MWRILARLQQRWANRLFRRGVEAYVQHNRARAQTLWERALEWFERSDDSSAVARCLNSLGNLYQQLGQLTRALDYYERAYVLHRQLGDHRGQAADLGNLGVVYQEVGKLEEARQHYQRSLMLCQEISHQLGMANQLGNLGTFHYLAGNLSSALEFYERALHIHRDVGDRLKEAMDLGNIGETYRLLGNPEQAREYQLQALDIHRELGDKWGQAATLGTLGLIEQIQDHLPQAHAYFEEALDLHRQLEDLSGQSRDLIHLGNVHRQMGDLVRAQACCEEALTLSRNAGYQRDEASALAGLGLVCQELGDLTQALAYQTQALNLADQLGMPELAWWFLGARGDTQRLQLLYELAYQDYRAAIELIESMRSRLTVEEHRLGFVTEVRESAYTRIITLLAEREGCWNPAEALIYVERAKSRVFLEQLATTLLPAPTGITYHLLDQERQLVQRLSGLIASRRRVGVANPERNEIFHEIEGELQVTWEMLETVVPEYVVVASRDTDIITGFTSSFDFLMCAPPKICPSTFI